MLTKTPPPIELQIPATVTTLVHIQSPTAEIRRGKKKELELWANAQRDGHPAEYRWRRLRKFRNSIPSTMRRKV